VPVEKLTQERRRQLTRDALVEAAEEVFAQKGYYGASLEEIASAAGFTRGAIYSNFGSKEELLFAVIDRFFERQLEAFQASFESVPDRNPVRDAISAAAVFQSFSSQSRTITAMELELRLAALRNPDVRKRLAEVERRMSHSAADLVEREMSRHGLTLDMPARDLGDIGRAAVEGLLQLAAIDDDERARYESLIETVFILMARASVKPA